MDSHPNLKLRNESIYFSRAILEHKEEYLILDTETSGLGKKDVIIQIAVIDLDGNTIIDSLIQPKNRKSISREATIIHGITLKKLQNAPHFADVYFTLLPFIEAGKKFLIYNFDFDARMIDQTIEADKLCFRERLTGRCIMLAYSKFIGEWNPLYHDYKFQKLPGGDHSALGDSLATLELIHFMAAQEPSSIPEGYKPALVATPNASENENKKEGNESNMGCMLALVFIIIVILSTC